MHNRRNYYRILNVQPDAPVEIIRSSYRTLMHQLKQHPDLGGDHWNAVLINEAYAVLTDPVKRAQYDHQWFARRPDGVGVDTPLGRKEKTESPFPQTSLQPDCLFCHLPHQYGQHIHVEALCSACRSPLYPIQRQGLPSIDRRVIDRINKRHMITFYTHWPQPEGYTGESLDMSLNGMKFVTLKSVTEGQILKIDCTVCRAVGEVSHSEPQGGSSEPLWVVGVQFVRLRFERSSGSFVSTHV